MNSTQSIYMFNSFPRDILEKLFKDCVSQHYRKNQLLFGPGEVIKNIYWISEGMMEISISNEIGKKQVIAYHYQDTLVGEINAISGDETFQSCIAIKESVLYKCDIEVFYNRIIELDLMRQYLRQLVRKTESNNIHLADIALNDCDTRISQYFNNDLTHQQLSELIGCTRVQVTRSLNKKSTKLIRRPLHESD